MDGQLTGPVINAILSVLVGMVLWGVRAINSKLSQLNGRLGTHIENPSLHFAAQARTEEQLKSLMQVTQALHARLDRVAHDQG